MIIHRTSISHSVYDFSGVLVADCRHSQFLPTLLHQAIYTIGFCSFVTEGDILKLLEGCASIGCVLEKVLLEFRFSFTNFQLY